MNPYSLELMHSDSSLGLLSSFLISTGGPSLNLCSLCFLLCGLYPNPCSCSVPFPLTPALSLRERETSSTDFGVPWMVTLFTTAKPFSLSLGERAGVRGRARPTAWIGLYILLELWALSRLAGWSLDVGVWSFRHI